MGNFTGVNINNTVNGAGLPGNIPALTGTHVQSSFTTSWSSTPDTTIGNIFFNFNSVHNLTSFSFWNVTGSSGTTARGIQGVSIATSLDGLNYTALAGAPSTFARGTTAPGPVQRFNSFTPTNAQYVRFNVISNYGATQTGFAEAQFDGTAVAVPWETDALPVVGTTVLFGLGVWSKNRLAKTRQKHLTL